MRPQQVCAGQLTLISFVWYQSAVTNSFHRNGRQACPSHQNTNASCSDPSVLSHLNFFSVCLSFSVFLYCLCFLWLSVKLSKVCPLTPSFSVHRLCQSGLSCQSAVSVSLSCPSFSVCCAVGLCCFVGLLCISRVSLSCSCDVTPYTLNICAIKSQTMPSPCLSVGSLWCC